MKNYDAKTVPAYIAGAAHVARPKLKELRRVIKAAVPGAEEGIHWGVPFYKYRGILAGFVTLKNHVDFGLVTVLAAIAKRGHLG